MGMINRLIGGAASTRALGEAATGLAEVFIPNATRKMETAHDAYIAALEEHGAEFVHIRPGRFDRFVNGLNRLPRPFLAFGTLGLFVYAMIEPEGFAHRMVGLNHVPEPLWWLLGAIVGFYFGARETHYLRARSVTAPGAENVSTEANPALEEWRATVKALD